MAQARDVNEYLTDPTTRDDPYPLLAQLREQQSVVPTDAGPWLALSYDAVRKAYISKHVSRWQMAVNELDVESAATPEIKQAIEAWQQMLINRDGADHARLRVLTMAAFTPKALQKWYERIDTIVVRLIDAVVDMDEFDFRTEVGFPLPEMVICEMLGVPVEDHAQWSKWTHDTVGLNRTAKAGGDNLIKAQEATLSFYNYFLELVDQRRQKPADDLLSMLIKARDENDKLSTDEIIGAAQMLIAAGHETTANLITSMMYHMVKNPADLQALRDDPSRIPDAVQEAVRLYSPAHFGLPRVTTEAVDIDGVHLPAGSPLIAIWAAGNRDPKVFDDPNLYNINRPNLAKQTGFGFGPHVCIGRRLAEMEAERMFQEIVARLPDYELAEDPQIGPSFTRGYTSLRLRRKS